MTAESAVYTFSHRAVIDKAPKASGVYCIFTSKRWVYVEESDDIQQSLFTHLNEPSACLHRFSPLSFSFQLTSPAVRRARLDALVAARPPACHVQDVSVGRAPRRSFRPWSRSRVYSEDMGADERRV
jgi:hypothetical protein